MTTINATSILMEASRDGQSFAGQTWEPFVMEYSSAISAILIVPLIIAFSLKVPLYWSLVKQNIFWHLLGSGIYWAVALIVCCMWP